MFMCQGMWCLIFFLLEITWLARYLDALTIVVSRPEKLEAMDKEPFYLAITCNRKNFLNDRSRLLDLSKFILMHFKKVGFRNDNSNWLDIAYLCKSYTNNVSKVAVDFNLTTLFSMLISNTGKIQLHEHTSTRIMK